LLGDISEVYITYYVLLMKIEMFRSLLDKGKFFKQQHQRALNT